MSPDGPKAPHARPARRDGRLAVLVLALGALLAGAAGPAAAIQITAQSAAGFPSEHAIDPPANAIDNNTSTYTWTTAALNTASPSYLAIGFTSSSVNRLRILKTIQAGGGTGSGVKNLVIQYTRDTGALGSRSWSNVPNLRNGNRNEGFFGAEPLSASAVNLDGTVTGDEHNGFASLTFDTVQATGLRIGFFVTTGGTCSSNLTGPCNHYRVGELQAHFDPPPAPAPPAPTPAGGTPAPSLGEWIAVAEGSRALVKVTSANGNVQTAEAGESVQLQPGDKVEVFGDPDAEVEVENSQENTQVISSSWEGVQCSNGADSEFSVTQQNQMQNTCGELEVQTAGAREDSRERALHQAGGAFALTPEAGAQVRGRARLVRDQRRGLTTVTNLRGSAQVNPVNPALRSLRLVPGQQVRVTRSSISPPFALVPDLRNEIPSPRQVRAGPALVTAPSRLSLRSLKSSKCVRVAVSSSKPARVLVTIFSGRRSVRLFGQRLVRFAAAGRTITCILVPRRARTFNVRTPLSFAVGYALGLRPRTGERPTRPVIRPIALVP